MSARPFASAALLAPFAVFALVACGDDTGSGGAGGSGSTSAEVSSGATSPASSGTTTVASSGSGGDPGTGGSGGDEVVLPSPDDLIPGEWNEIQPGGDTICARGTPYSYWVRPGTSNKVMVDFIGGGACWNELTCGLAGQIFSDDIDDISSYFQNDGAGFDGVYDHDNPDNPVGEYWHVVVPYCTGDIHWGDATVTYGEGSDDEVTIEHKGAVNARTVLDWVYDGFDAPEKVFVTGCSAGSYGSALWAAHIMDHYEGTPVVQFGDSGAGIITPTFFEESFPQWNAEQAFPAFIPSLDPAEIDIESLALPDLYSGIANAFVTNRMSQYNTFRDDNQFFYFSAMGGGDIDEWNAQMLASIAAIEDATGENFASYIAQGEQHCIIPYANFYDAQVGDVRLTDWLRDMLDGPVESVTCEGADCEAPTPGEQGLED
jgi:hypothetical protein